MKVQIDLKSAVCGLIVGIAAMFVIGAGESSNQNGRYQVSSGAGQSIIVDSQTGQAWAFNTGSSSRSDGNFFNPKTQ